MKSWWLNMIFLFGPLTLPAQTFPDIHFTRLTQKEGLSNNDVSCITQDGQGFIWIGTSDGLNRFDGYRIKKIYHDPGNENSVVNNCIYQVVPDAEDRLWIATREGLSVYNKQTGAFRNFRHNPRDPGSLDNDQFDNIYTEAGLSTWITTPTSVYNFDSGFQFRRIRGSVLPLKDGDKSKVESYGRLTSDRQGNIWASRIGYVFLIDKKNMQISRRFGPFNGTVEAIYQDSELKYWIGFFGCGLVNLDPLTGKSFEVKLAGSTLVVHSITEWWDQFHKRWLVLGTDGGVRLVDPVTLKSKAYHFHLGFSQQSSSHFEVQHVFVDRQNILWIGTEAGVFYAEPSRQLYDLWNMSGNSSENETNNSDWAYSIAETGSGYWMSPWIGKLLYFFNKEGELKDSATLQSVRTPQGEYLSPDSKKPYYVMNQGDSVLWFTTDAYLIHYDLRSKQGLAYRPEDAKLYTGLRTITILDSAHWWIRTRNNGANGIYIFDPLRKKFLKHFVNSPDCDKCVSPRLFFIYLDGRHEIYISSVGRGLFKFDPQTDQFDPVFSFQGEDLKNHSNSFEAMTEDNSGNFWIGTYNGLICWNPTTKKLVKDYCFNETLGGVEISGVLFDSQQNLWLSTSRGIFYMLHNSGNIYQLTPTEGLTDNTNGIFQAGQDHSILVGIQGNILHLRTEEVLRPHRQTLPVHFSEATVMDSPSFFRQDRNGNKQLIMKPGQNRFTLDFSIMNYDGDNRYYYRLDDGMSDWQQNDNGHLAFYNLAPGKYKLHVKGGNRSGDLTTIEDEVTIIIQPHWWQTEWFKIMCGLIIISLVTVFVRRRIALIRQEASFRQKIAETEMMALRSQMNPHFIFNSLNSIENFMMQNEKRQASNYLNKFARLIRTILDSSRNELIPVSRDLEALKLYVDLEQLRFNNKFRLNLQIDPALLNGDYRVPALLIQPYVENAIIHGLAQSERDDLLLNVSACLKDGYIHYRVEDNGIGRWQSAKYNQQNKPHHKSVGLTISKERIQLFNKRTSGNGSITISDLNTDSDVTGTRVDIRIKVD